VEVTRDSDIRFAHARDASGLELVPEAVSRPTSAGEVAETVREFASAGMSVTPAGSQTSMTGSSITSEGALMSLTGMSRIIDIDSDRRIARVEPGVRIGDLNRALESYDLLFAPDPTSENDATIGGSIACNASGARTLHYGPTRNHVAGLRVVHADGSIKSYTRDHPEKNCVGYWMVQDPVDWFVGSEGTLGIVVEADLSLVDKPLATTGLAIPFETLDHALGFVVAARDSRTRSARCLELFDDQALTIAGSASGRPWPEIVQALIYLEDDAGIDSTTDDVLAYWLDLAEQNEALSNDIRVFQSASELREARIIRHSVPATMNERGAAFRSKGGRKVSTDWAVPYAKLADALRESAIAIERHGASAPVTYGHAGNGHPHQNFIAEDEGSLERINAAVHETLQRVISMGGTVSAEHGLGKLKRHWMALQLSPSQMGVMRQIKHALDPSGIFSPGNIF
jgi:FAD/FMN-containing dehydrogenase